MTTTPVHLAGDSPPELFGKTTILSLLATLAILLTAYAASLRLLPTGTSTKLRGLYIWHLSDALCHFILEGSFLYNCFTIYTPLPAVLASLPDPASLGGHKFGHFLGHADRAYGSRHGDSALAKLWQEYAKADARWGGADLGVISLEILTVFLAGPCALYVSELIRKGAGREVTQGTKAGAGVGSAKLWFWATMLATGELYGGFMTFCPEWLSGNANLDSSNFMYLWVYLVFFNMLWVFIPFWVLYEAFQSIRATYALAEAVAPASSSKVAEAVAAGKAGSSKKRN